MKINTKFSLGDQVYYMKSNKIHIGHITKICVSYSEPNWYSESYYMKEDMGLNPPFYSRNELFKTKEDLLKSL